MAEQPSQQNVLPDVHAISKELEDKISRKVQELEDNISRAFTGVDEKCTAIQSEQARLNQELDAKAGRKYVDQELDAKAGRTYVEFSGFRGPMANLSTRFYIDSSCRSQGR